MKLKNRIKKLNHKYKLTKYAYILGLLSAYILINDYDAIFIVLGLYLMLKIGKNGK